jgi:predicted aconitase
MRLTEEQRRILEGKEGEILQQAMVALVRYGTAMGAEELIPISSAHTFFMSPESVAEYFPPRKMKLTGRQIAQFCERLSRVRVRARMTVNPGPADLDKWDRMGASEVTQRSLRQVTEISRRCGMLTNWTCIPHLLDNPLVFGEHCSWSESSALIYVNSMIGARTNRDGGQASFFSGLLGLTPDYGLHRNENRRGTHIIDVQCRMDQRGDWGALGYYAGEKAGDGIPVFVHLRAPTVEEAKQLGAAVNVPGGAAMFHIVGVTPEAPTISAAFGANEPLGTYVFDAIAKKETYGRANHQPAGKVDMVFLGCPHATLFEIAEISRLLEGRKVARGTKLWVMTAHSVRASAERLGYARVIEESGADLLADGCLLTYYVYFDSQRPPMGRVATDSLKQALGVKRSFGSKVFFGSTEACIEAAIQGGV